jgi:hypothetical protein
MSGARLGKTGRRWLQIVRRSRTGNVGQAPNIRHRPAVGLTVMARVVVTGSAEPPTEQEAGPVSPVRKSVIRAVDRAPLAGRVYAGCHDELGT